MERGELADFLRSRRVRLSPSDVGVTAGGRRRTPGLRREEVAQLAGISSDYYTRLEQARGPHPSSQVLSALARALRLTEDERTYLYQLVDRPGPYQLEMDDNVRPGLRLVLDRLDTPALVISALGDVLAQNRMAVAVLGDLMERPPEMRNVVWRWFTDPSAKKTFAETDWDNISHANVSDLRAMMARNPADSRAAELVERLQAISPEFTNVWKQHDVEVRRSNHRTFVHSVAGRIDVDSEVLSSAGHEQRLIIYSAQPGTESYERLELLRTMDTHNRNAAANDGRSKSKVSNSAG